MAQACRPVVTAGNTVVVSCHVFKPPEDGEPEDEMHAGRPSSD